MMLFSLNLFLTQKYTNILDFTLLLASSCQKRDPLLNLTYIAMTWDAYLYYWVS